MTKKIGVFLWMIAIASFAVCAKEAVFDGENYTLQLDYNDTVKQGDAVFVRMIVSRAKKQTRDTSGETTARLTLEKDNTTEFFPVTPRGGQKQTPGMYSELLAALPISTWHKAGAYTMTISYLPFGGSAMTFDLPLTVQKKNFISETIELDDRNTGIRTNTSPERVAQSEKLTKIIFTKNKDGVHQQRAFKPPTTAKRITSFFGDRRVYAYSNGKNSTSEHFGTDYGVPTGTPVTACANGRVVLAENRITTGWSVVIEHLPGLYSLYYHMDSISVDEGENVKLGAKIGASGATGLATGPHLHWEVRLNGTAVNPDFFTEDFSFFDKAN